MTQANRLASGGEIDRSCPLSFSFEGRALEGYAGDTLASALLANGVKLVGRSFKYHRPRGLLAAGVEEPNAILDVAWPGADGKARHEANARATQVELAEGLAARGVNAAPDLAGDRGRWLDRLARFLPAGFYYKTFMRPGWHAWEPRIRALAGLGRVRPTADERRFEQQHGSCDVLVIGAGPAGLAAARAAAEAGLSVWLVEQEARPGGQLLWRDDEVEGQAGAAWAAACWAALGERPNVRLFPRTQATAYYDHNRVALVERRPAAAPGWGEERLWLVRAARVILATGALERPLVFPDNDRPGVMLASAAATYLRRWAVLPGRRIVVATNNDDAYAAALVLRAGGAAVLVADLRAAPDAALLQACAAAGIEVRSGVAPLGVEGRNGVEALRLGRPDATSASGAETVACDLVCVSGGWSPAVHLFSQSGGKLAYDEGLAAFLPARPAQAETSVGAAAGAFGLQACLDQGHAAGLVALTSPSPAGEGREGVVTASVESANAPSGSVPSPARRAPATRPPQGREALGGTYAIQPFWRTRVAGARQWIDFQNDVTAKDVALAAREGYVSVEHLKRYTTLGMATDQGKTANVNGLAILAEETGRAPGSVGTTTFRPPYTPVTLGAIAGLKRGLLLQTRRHLPAHARQRAAGALFRDYGLWYRPACYPGDGESEAEAITREVRAVRRGVGLLDGSSLGKIEVAGPDAAEFLNRLYYNELKSLKPGRLRYCLLLRESGVVFDDGVVARLGEDRFLLSPSSSHADGVYSMLQEWHRGEWPDLRLHYHDATQAWATYALSGPQAKAVLAKLATDIAWAALPHMGLAEGTLEGVPARIARVSFTGELSYELSVPAAYGVALWDRLLQAGAAFGIAPYGIESLAVLRAEKGYILIGRDTDGVTLPQDLGMSGPLAKKDLDYVGRRSLFTPEAKRADRRQLVGLAAEDAVPLATGAHVVVREDGSLRSQGFVTSSYASPTLGHPVALGLVEAGRARLGERVETWHLGQSAFARIVEPCVYDPKGEKLHG